MVVDNRTLDVHEPVVGAGPYPTSTAAWGAQKNCPDFYVCSHFLANILATKNYNLSLDSVKKDTLLELWEFLKYLLYNGLQK